VCVSVISAKLHSNIVATPINTSMIFNSCCSLRFRQQVCVHRLALECVESLRRRDSEVQKVP
jgi:hypothetical protein